jgi:hypothetical protein
MFGANVPVSELQQNTQQRLSSTHLMIELWTAAMTADVKKLSC